MAISTVSFGNTPQAVDDLFLASATGLTEDSRGIVYLAVMDNDKGGAAKTLWSLDDGTSAGGIRPVDLLTQDLARSEAMSTDTSAAGARIWITSDGRVGYDAATLSADFLHQLQQLNAGEVLTDSFTYAIRLGNGTLSWATAVVQFAGLNDAPVVTGVVMGNAVEDGASVTLDALAHASDVDRGSVLQVVDVPTTLPPGVSYDAATHSFTLDPSHAAYQHLAANQTVPVTVLYGVSDGIATTPASVTFTVTGTNDAAQIGEANATDVTEDTAVGTGGMLSASGTLSISDVDDGEAGFQTAVQGHAGNLGSLTLGADGNYTYSVANADVQFLGAHKVHEDHFTVRSIDGTSKELTFTIHGVNDAAVMTGPDHASVTEDTGEVDGQLAVSGTLGITDADQGEASFRPGATGQAGNLGSLMLDKDGSYTYTVSNAKVQFLGADDSHVDTFTVTAFDGTTKEVQFTIHGTNDVPVIGEPTVSDVIEDAEVNAAGHLAASGSISIDDVDQGQSAFQTDVTGDASNLGHLTLAVDGSYAYTVDNSKVQYLGEGQTKVDTFTVTSLDGTTKEVQFTIHGTNDVPVIGEPTVSDVIEDAEVNATGHLVASGSISIDDVDQGQSAFQTKVIDADGNLGHLNLQSNGTYTYTVANSAAQHLGEGETKVDTFTVTSLDGTTKEVRFTITGVNDAADIGLPTVRDVIEDTAVDGAGNLVASGSISITDVDQGQAFFQTEVTGAAGNLGHLDLHANGTYTYTVANSAVQFLGDGKTHEDVFTVTSHDGTTRQVSFITTGVNDAAVIGDPNHAVVTEDVGVSAGQLTATGTISISDADHDQASFQATVGAATGNLGSLVLAADGSYTYSVANAAVQFLGANDTHVDTFTLTSLDGTTKKVSFTIQGTNDVAVIGGTTSGSVQEDTGVVGGLLTTGGALTVTDADAGQAAFQAQASVAGTYGTFALTAGGAWTYSVSNDLAAVQALNTGQSLTDTFTAWSLDGSASQAVTVTIQGLDDVVAMTGGTGPNTYSFDAAKSGQSTISDAGGKDVISITGSGALSALNFERVGNDLQIQVNQQTITVLNHYGAAANAIEQITFGAGQSFAGYTLAGSSAVTYDIFSGSGFVGPNGNHDDVIAGTSADQTLDGGPTNNNGRDLLFGNAGDDRLMGGAGDDLLVGGDGNDRLEGGDGNDVLVGGAGNDVFVFNTSLGPGNVDHIWDFQADATDTILLSKAVFSGLATAGSAAGTTLQAGDFFAGAGAASANVGSAHILFDTSTGNLYYDADGGGTGGRTLFATLDLPNLTGTVDASDFKVGL